MSAINTVDMFSDCKEFTDLFTEKTGKHFSGKIDKKFITQMVKDELDELNEAKDEAEEVDALLDAVYYILNHLATTGLDIRPIWKIIHKANMTNLDQVDIKEKMVNGANHLILYILMKKLEKKFYVRDLKNKYNIYLYYLLFT